MNKKYGLSCNFDSPIAVDFLIKAISFFQAQKLDFSVENNNILRTKYPNIDYRDLDDFKPEYVIVFGGDGTILRIARYVNSAPILSIRTPPSRGFLAEVDGSKGWPEVEQYLGRFLNNEFYTVSQDRLIIDPHSLPHKADIPPCLNEFLVSAADVFKTVIFSVQLNTEESELTASADGIIIATASGSTGHAMSCGGPIIHYSVPVIELCLINPMYHGSQPLILPTDKSIKITAKTKANNARIKIIIDGQVTREFPSPFNFSVSKAVAPTNFVRFKGFVSRLSRSSLWK